MTLKPSKATEWLSQECCSFLSSSGPTQWSAKCSREADRKPLSSKGKSSVDGSAMKPYESNWWRLKAMNGYFGWKNILLPAWLLYPDHNLLRFISTTVLCWYRDNLKLTPGSVAYLTLREVAGWMSSVTLSARPTQLSQWLKQGQDGTELGRGKKAVTPVPGQLVQKGFEQQVITPTFVSALPEPDNRLR